MDPASPIETDEAHRAALEEIEALWGAEEGTLEGQRLDALAAQVAAYEERRWPIEGLATNKLATEREASRRLARLGGSDPTATAGPRRRSR